MTSVCTSCVRQQWIIDQEHAIINAMMEEVDMLLNRREVVQREG